jgi:GT2 family glycosyltransferase
MDTAIIIVNHNHKDSIIKLIESLYQFNDMDSSNIIFIQNTSSPYLENYLKNFTNIIFIQNEKIKGFAENVNYGIKIARDQFDPEYFLLLNPDVRLKENLSAPFKKLINSDKGIGIIAPKLLNDYGSLQYSCRRFYNLRYVFKRMFRLEFIFGSTVENNILMKDFNHDKVSAVDWVSGAVMFFTKSLLNQVGFFDEKNYFMYAEDQDICLRSWHSNLKVIYHSDVECYHSYGRKGSSLMPSKYSFYQLISTINMFKKFNFQLRR